MTAAQSFFVSPRGDTRHGHVVEADSFEEAAVAFAERWSPPVDADGDIALIVRDREDGREICLRLDLDSGEAQPCG
ncbi:MAG: hypothetical protein BGN86_00910 [Caulobacterales bacterium 68-7]|nr:hypothetical protein [Caulobacterales bacterium]OJU10701.1 MAG: hypothetical protein BGN86_00910 [Caulobacterales bacterium 68-7]